MKKGAESRIINRKRADGKTEISVYFPEAEKAGERNKESRTGLVVPADQVDKVNREIAEKFNRAGDQVGFTEI